MPKIKILVVEDESLVAKDIQNMLRGLGYEVMGVFSTGEEALVALRESDPDLVLVDIVLKGKIDGIVTAERIWETYGIPVIYLTAYADETTLLRAKVTEPFGYILKPFNERELQTTIEMAFYKAKMDKTLREREQWLSTILKSIGDGVIVTDIEDLISFMNPLAERLTGWNQSDVLKRPLADILPNQPAAPAELSNGPAPAVENVLTAKGGEKIPIEQTVTAFIDARKRRLGNVLVFRDITRHKRTEADLRASWSRLQKALAGTIEAMRLTIETRDPYTAGHQRRVSQLSCAIAQDLGLPQEQIDGLRMAGDIHDLGKIYIPAQILSKPGYLTDIEFSILRMHAQVGYDILKSIEFPWPLAQIIYQHHEKLDGSGYPNNLKDGEILLEARIIGVADVVEAMSSHRPYRPSHGVEKALEEITQNRGRLYDAAVVDGCLGLFREKGFSFD